VRMLDLFCGAGGAARGYHDAGFDVLGVDIDPQPNYPYEFIQADALEFLGATRFVRNAFDAVHASPPCQAFSDLQKQNKRSYPELVAPTRALLLEVDLPYVIENVEGAPLIDPITLCGTMFDGLRVKRHRLFESNVRLSAPRPCPGKHPLVFTFDRRKNHFIEPDRVAERAEAQRTMFVQVTGGGNATVANKADAMGIDWMTGKELNEAIPPAYTEWVGRQLAAHVRMELAA
jgi:DNA (cytosine-5)-methyltransferase 1